MPEHLLPSAHKVLRVRGEHAAGFSPQLWEANPLCLGASSSQRFFISPFRRLRSLAMSFSDFEGSTL